MRLQHHIENKHSSALPPAICRLCREKFQTKEALKQHWTDDHEDKNKGKKDKILCSICEEEVPNNFLECFHTC